MTTDSPTARALFAAKHAKDIVNSCVPYVDMSPSDTQNLATSLEQIVADGGLQGVNAKLVKHTVLAYRDIGFTLTAEQLIAVVGQLRKSLHSYDYNYQYLTLKVCSNKVKQTNWPYTFETIFSLVSSGVAQAPSRQFDFLELYKFLYTVGFENDVQSVVRAGAFGSAYMNSYIHTLEECGFKPSLDKIETLSKAGVRPTIEDRYSEPRYSIENINPDSLYYYYKTLQYIGLEFPTIKDITDLVNTSTECGSNINAFELNRFIDYLKSFKCPATLSNLKILSSSRVFPQTDISAPIPSYKLYHSRNNGCTLTELIEETTLPSLDTTESQILLFDILQITADIKNWVSKEAYLEEVPGDSKVNLIPEKTLPITSSPSMLNHYAQNGFLSEIIFNQAPEHVLENIKNWTQQHPAPPPWATAVLTNLAKVKLVKSPQRRHMSKAH